MKIESLQRIIKLLEKQEGVGSRDEHGRSERYQYICGCDWRLSGLDHADDCVVREIIAYFDLVLEPSKGPNAHTVVLGQGDAVRWATGLDV